MPTVDDLAEVYDEAYENRARLEFPTPEMKRAMHRAGISAVVERLRDEMDDKGHYEIHLMFNEILGGESEKVATACATSQTTGVTDGNRQSERERHFPQGLQAVDGAGTETVGRCERCGGAITRRDQSQLAFEVAILGDYETRRGRNVGSEGDHSLNEKVADGLPDDAVPIPLMHPESAISAPATDPAPAVCEWRANEYEGAYSPGCEKHAVWYSDGSETPQAEGYNFCPSCGKPIRFTEAK